MPARMPDRFRAYRQAVAYLEGLTNIAGPSYLRDRKHPERYLKRTRWFLDLLGRPDRGLRFIHIGGTAGKGSVATMVHRCLVRSGQRAGLFTSPFTTTSIEKIAIGDRYVAPLQFARAVETLKPFIDQAYAKSPFGGPSYFEAFFALALTLFRQQRCRWAVLEVGLGGRYDATNAIIRSQVGAITNIDFDHTQILGRTLTRIAWDKAGIIKPGQHFFTTETRPPLRKIFERICRAQGARLTVVIPNATGLHSLFPDFPLPVSPKTDGQEQIQNVALAVAIAKDLGLKSRPDALGVAETRLSARFEIMQWRPLVILDGAHSVIKMKSTAMNLRRLRYRRLTLILAIAADKDVSGIIRQIAPLADRVFATKFQNPFRACTDPARITQEVRRFARRGTTVEISTDPQKALRHALTIAKDSDAILVTGSFYLAGELRQRWFSEEWVLRHRKSF